MSSAMEAVHPLEAGGSSLGNTKRSARHGVILKGVGAKVRNGEYLIKCIRRIK